MFFCQNSIVTYGNSFKKASYLRPWMKEYGAANGVSRKGLKGVIAGGITGGIEVCITYPTEYVKIQLQLDEKGASKRYSGIIDCMRKTVKTYGLFGLYRGLSVPLYGSVPKLAFRFGAFETLKKWSVNDKGNLSPSGRLLCGLGAGVCEAVFAVTLIETVKVKFINDRRLENPRFKGFLHGVRLILKEQGFRGIYQGVSATVLKQGSNQALRFYVMETCKDIYRGGDPTNPVPKLLVGIFGFFAAVVSVLGNTPIDVVKTRMQGLEASKYKNTLDCIVKIVRNEGPMAFYKGTVPRLGKVCLEVPITFMVYDSLMDIFNNIIP